jgi:fructokinase
LKRSTLPDENPGAMRIGIDLGGTKIEGVALDDQGVVRARLRVGTPRDDYEGTVEAIAGVVLSLEQEAGARATVGVGMPGAISPATGLVKNANSTWLIGRPLDRDLAARLARPVRLANDANCFALSEAVDGAGRDGRVVFGVIVGTGTGGGVVVDRKVLTGPNAIAGEWGHNPLPWPDASEWPGPPCYCGKTGCVETFLSGTGLARDYREATGESVPGPAVVERAGRGEAAASAALARYEGRMARALAAVLNVLDPDVVVLGGGVSQVARLYENVPRLWQAWSFSDRVDTRLRPPVHGDASGVRGAAWLWGPGEEG